MVQGFGVWGKGFKGFRVWGLRGLEFKDLEGLVVLGFKGLRVLEVCA